MTDPHFVTRKDSTPLNGPPSTAVMPLPDERPGIAGRRFAALPLSVRSHLHV